MTLRSRVTPRSRTYRISRRTLVDLDSLSLELDLPRGKVADIALRMFFEAGEEAPGAGEIAESPTRLRLSSTSVALLRKREEPQPAVLEAAVDCLRCYLRDHNELPLRFLISGASRIAKKATAGKS